MGEGKNTYLGAEKTLIILKGPRGEARDPNLVYSGLEKAHQSPKR
jgi:hypothetical protein